MLIQRLFIAAMAGLFAFSARAASLPTPSARTVVLTGADVASGLKVTVRKDPAALGGAYVSPSGKYQRLALSSLPAEGDSLRIWVHYRNLALQVKTTLDGKTVEFPWSWQRNADGFAWRLAGTFKRAELGPNVWFINDPKYTDASGIDALVITADTAWKPVAFAADTAPAENPDAPDAANATTRLTAPPPPDSTAPGSATVFIDWTGTGASVPPLLYGLNNFRGASPERMARPDWHAGIAYMAPSLLRIHPTKGWFNAEGAWDYAKIRASIEAGRPPAGTERMITITSWPASYDADNDGRLDPARIDDFARLCADLVRYVNLELKAGVRYWEITNEKDFAYWRKPRNGNPPDVAALAKLYTAAAAAIRAVDPAVKIGGPAACSPLPLEPLVRFARLAGDQLDFFSFHDYASGSGDETDQTIYEKVSVMASDAADLIRRVQKVAHGRPVQFFLDEFNICYSWRVKEPRMANNKGAVFDALALIAYARVPGLTGTAAWNDQDGVYGKMDNAGVLRPGAHVYHYFNTLLRGPVAAASSNAPQSVVAFAVTGARPAFVLVNRTGGEQTVTLSGAPAKAGPWEAASIDASGLRPFPVAPSPFSAPVTLSPHSVNFYWLNQ